MRPREEAREWLALAGDDLRTAELAMGAGIYG